MSLAMHLTRRSGGVYYYRQRIPRQISAHYDNRKEICFSLNTKEPFEAKQLSYAYSLKYSQEFDRYNKQIQSNSSNQFYCSSAHTGMNGNEGKEWECDGTTENILKKRNIETGFEDVIASHEDEVQQVKISSRAPTFRQVWEMYVQSQFRRIA